jgi:DNA-binding LacI/PurR family transcriptional regulator
MSGKRHLTIEDIASMAEVSISTVSRVLNNSGPVRQTTRNKIMKIIKNTNYTPNGLARGLRKTSKTIGLLIPDIKNLFFIEVINGIEDYLNQHGYSAFFCNVNWNSSKEKEYIELMVERRVEGLVIMSAFCDESVIRNLPTDIQTVSIQSGVKGIDSVYSKDQEGAREATEYLLSLGHRNIAFFGFKNIKDSLNNRLNGYKEALQNYDIPYDPQLVLYADPNPNIGYELTQRLLELPQLPTAILAIYDQMVPGIYGALNEKGISVPGDISIIGFDNTVLCEWIHPKLTTVSLPNYEMGKVAAELLIDRITNDRKICKEVYLPTKLIIRESTSN